MSQWKLNPILLTEKLVIFIGQNAGVTLDVLEARAIGHGVPMHIFDQAIANLHKLKGVKRIAIKDTVKYELQEIKKKNPLSHITWRNENYPVMDETNDAHHPAFADLDFSYLFLTPDELQEYKAQLKGQRFIKKKSYEHARR